MGLLDISSGTPPRVSGSAKINAQRAGQPIQNEPRRGLLSRISGGLTDFSDNLLQFVTSPNGQIALGLLSAAAPTTAPGGPGSRIGPAVQNTLNQMAQRQFFQSQIDANRARTFAALQGGSDNKPLTDIAKLGADLANGNVTPEIYQARVDQILSEAVNDKFEQTQKLRGEFSKETSGVRTALQSLTSAQALLANGSNPIAELAAFISTIKSIDNSTVREGELRNFNRAVGLVNQLESLVSRAKGEGFSEGVARDIADTVTRLRAPLEKVLRGSQDFFNKEAEKFKLDPSSITGGAVPEAIPVTFNGQSEQPRSAENIDAEIAELDAEIASLKQALKEGS